MKEGWILKDTKNLNQIQKIRANILNIYEKEHFPQLLTIKHNYITSDDILFPEISTLSFLNAFEDIKLKELDELNEIIHICTDIANGSIDIHLYTKDANKSIYDCIDYLKTNPLFKVEFVISHDKNWDFYNSLIIN